MRSLPLTLVVLLGACGDGAADPPIGADATGKAVGTDASPGVTDGAPDTGRGDGATILAGPPDAGPPDALGPDADRDAAPDRDPPRCSAPPNVTARPTGPLPPPINPRRGVDAWEQASYDRLLDVALADEGVHFLATWSWAREAFVISAGAPDRRVEVVFRRVRRPEGGVTYEVVEGALADVFPSTDADRLSELDVLLDAFENPSGLDLSELGYAPRDPRVGFLPADRQAYPLPLVRLATLFDAPDAPDAVIGLYPWATPATATHGQMGLLHSRSALIFSGYGARRGVRIPGAAHHPDIAPTVLAALGAPTTSGIGPDGVYDDGLYLARQDGRVLWEALDPAPCVRPDHVVVILFDGLSATEINHALLGDPSDEDELELPIMREMARDGVVYEAGAIVGFPSLSAPGHMTTGTGLWPGHHGLLGNSYFGRPEQRAISPFALLDDPAAYLADPEAVRALYERATAPGIETLSAAAHRALGRWDPGSGEGAYTAVINEIALADADQTTVDFLAGPRRKASLETYRIADNFALLQVKTLLRDRARPVPTILQISLLSTDGAGEMAGPHSPLLRQVLEEQDARVGAIRDEYQARDALDRTLFLLVSDHGMELQDPARATQITRRITEAGVRTALGANALIYLRTLEIEGAREVQAGQEVERLELQIRNHDEGGAVEGATITCTEGCPPQQVAASDSQGRASVQATPGVQVSLSITHPAFNPQTWQESAE